MTKHFNPALERKDADGVGNISAELLTKVAEIHKAHEEFRSKADTSTKAMEKAMEDVVRKDEVSRIEKAMDELVSEIAALKRVPRGGKDGEQKTAEQIAHQKAFVGYLRKGNDVGLAELEQKALSVGSDPDGGYMVTPDTSGRMVEKIYETSAIRQIANVQTISTDKLEGKEDLGEFGAGWVGETSSRPDTDTAELGRWGIEVFEMYAKPKATQKLLDDSSIAVEQWIADKAAARFARLENADFVTGNGTRKPKGFTAYSTAADNGSGVDWGKIGYKASGAAGAFSPSNPIDTLYDLIALLKSEYLPGARFIAKRMTINEMRKFKSGDGHHLWSPPTEKAPETFAGFPVTRAEDMPSIAANAMAIAFGNFAQAYQIVDRQGIRTLRDPYSSKPFVEFYTTKRVGGGVINFEAIKFMKFAAS